MGKDQRLSALRVLLEDAKLLDAKREQIISDTNRVFDSVAVGDEITVSELHEYIILTEQIDKALTGRGTYQLIKFTG